MPDFECSVCGDSFSVPQAAIDKYPGWVPKYCRAHSPQKSGAKKKAGGGARRGGSAREENLTTDEVLAKYTGGPQDGVFTDGSASPNPGPGGWGAVWVENGAVVREVNGREGHTTNNRMELTALIEAFKMLPEDAAVTLFTDSRLCVDTITKWAPNWEKKGWTKKGGEIKNLELVQELYALYHAHPDCALEWIAAHSGHRWNEYADALATAWMRE